MPNQFQSYKCWPFGLPSSHVWIRATSRSEARGLAAYRFRVHRSMICVEAEAPVLYPKMSF